MKNFFKRLFVKFVNYMDEVHEFSEKRRSGMSWDDILRDDMRKEAGKREYEQKHQGR